MRQKFSLPFLAVLFLVVTLPLVLFMTQRRLQYQQEAAGVLPLGQTGTWTMIFDDEFNGTTLDSSKWNTCFSNFSIGAGQCVHDQAELEVYNPQDVLLNSGVLTLRAEHKSFTAANGQTYQYPSGMLSSGPAPGGSNAKFEFRYGYAEMRAWLPKGNGLWPAFWMISAQTYPPEIDNFEVLGEAPSIINMHFHDEGGGDSGLAFNGPDTSAGWHVYGLDWESGFINWYVDGKLARNLATSISSNIKLYLIANLAVGGDWPVPPDSSTPFPADFKIDYIRVWQQGTVATNVTPPPAVSPAISASPAVSASPTPTSSAGSTAIALTVCPHGLGMCGDNVNASGTGTTSPKHTSRNITVSLTNSTNTVITAQGTLNYVSSVGNFQGSVAVPGLTSGQYTVKVQTAGFLPKQVSTPVTITAGQPVSIPSISLINGNINNDQQLDILDYNLLIGCYGTKQATASCTTPPGQTTGSDINDDGVVNGPDYNLFLRELSGAH